MLPSPRCGWRVAENGFIQLQAGLAGSAVGPDVSGMIFPRQVMDMARRRMRLYMLSWVVLVSD